jgi:aspartate kinase
VTHSGGLAKVSLVGTGMLNTPGVAARMFRTLADSNINIEMISTSEIRITCIVEQEMAEAAVRALHSAFDLDQVPATPA